MPVTNVSREFETPRYLGEHGRVALPATVGAEDAESAGRA